MKGRVLITAPHSGSGKTTVVCALLKALKESGRTVCGFKAGPDYLDPMIHREILGSSSHNLDLFLMGQEGVQSLLSQSQGDIGIIEGAMGFYDGIALGDSASAYDLAKITQTPVVLVVQGRGAALSLAAVVKGFVEFRPDSNIKGVIFNEISPMLYPFLKEKVEEECGISVLGFLPPCPDAVFESRHLGLVTGEEGGDFKEKVKKLGDSAKEYIDLAGILALGESATPLLNTRGKINPKERKIPLAVALDKAFSFYYEDNLARLEEVGFELNYFSPLRDSHLPDCCGLYLGGGYPELNAKALSENKSMLQDIREKMKNGLPTVGECGGFLYLHESLENDKGEEFPMVGIIEGRGYATKKLSKFGYVTLSLEKSGLLGEKGDKIPAHQFHYWDSTHLGDDFFAQKPQSSRNWREGHMTDTLYAGFPHFHFASVPETLLRFYEACQNFEKK